MGNKIATLKDKDNNDVYPVTLESCVYTENGVPLSDVDKVIDSYTAPDGNTWWREYESGWKEYGGKVLLGDASAVIDADVTIGGITFTQILCVNGNLYSCSSGTSWTFVTASIKDNSTIHLSARTTQSSGTSKDVVVSYEIKGY